MILPPDQAKLVARGVKTATRLPILGEKSCTLKPGQDYALQPGPSRDAICRIVVTKVDRGFLGDVTFDDARAEGFKTTAAFAVAWMRRYDRGWPPTASFTCHECNGYGHEIISHPGEPVAIGDAPCVECEGTGWLEVETEITDQDILDRFKQRHVDRPVWVVRFTLDRSHHPRLLHRLSERGYTQTRRDALADEPEAVDEITQAKLTKLSHDRAADASAVARREEEREIDRQVEAMLASLGLHEATFKTKAELRDRVVAAMRREQRRAA
jgi:hypothetical protein